METQKKPNSTEPKNEDLACWRASTNPQCLRVETIAEIHLLPYGYFQHAVFSRKDNRDFLLLRFGGTSVRVKGKRLDSLVAAIARLGVEQINLRPEKYVVKTSECIVTEIEVHANEGADLAEIQQDE
jgi:hypothetical protein